jgi:hypothetical protein
MAEEVGCLWLYVRSKQLPMLRLRQLGPNSQWLESGDHGAPCGSFGSPCGAGRGAPRFG